MKTRALVILLLASLALITGGTTGYALPKGKVITLLDRVAVNNIPVDLLPVETSGYSWISILGSVEESGKEAAMVLAFASQPTTMTSSVPKVLVSDCNTIQNSPGSFNAALAREGGCTARVAGPHTWLGMCTPVFLL
jgi:hypothetical protein